MLGQLSADTTAVFYNGLLNTADFSFQPDAVNVYQCCTAGYVIVSVFGIPEPTAT